MLSGLTKQEQHILLILIIIITAGLGFRHIQESRDKNLVYIDTTGQDIPESSLSGVDKSADATGWNLSGSAGTKSPDTSSLVPPKKDINTATVEDFDAVPGIGKTRAQAIIQYRDRMGGFKSLEQVKDIAGVGKKMFALLENNFFVEEETPARAADGYPDQAPPAAPQQTSSAHGFVNINTASVQQLCTLEGIGETLAQRIIEYREKYGGFKSIEELKDVHGIGDGKFSLNKDRITIY